MKTVKSMTFAYEITETLDESRNGRVIYTINVKSIEDSDIFDKTYDVEYRPTIEFMSSLNQLPTNHIEVNLEHNIRNDFIQKGISVQEVKFE